MPNARSLLLAFCCLLPAALLASCKPSTWQQSELAAPAPDAAFESTPSEQLAMRKIAQTQCATPYQRAHLVEYAFLDSSTIAVARIGLAGARISSTPQSFWEELGSPTFNPRRPSGFLLATDTKDAGSKADPEIRAFHLTEDDQIQLADQETFATGLWMRNCGGIALDPSGRLLCAITSQAVDGFYLYKIAGDASLKLVSILPAAPTDNYPAGHTIPEKTIDCLVAIPHTRYMATLRGYEYLEPVSGYHAKIAVYKVDPHGGAVKCEIDAPIHCDSLAATPDGKYLILETTPDFPAYTRAYGSRQCTLYRVTPRGTLSLALQTTLAGVTPPLSDEYYVVLSKTKTGLALKSSGEVQSDWVGSATLESTAEAVSSPASRQAAVK